MAELVDAAVGSTSVSIFLNEIKSSMSGLLNYGPKDANDKWVFAELNVPGDSSADLLTTSHDYLGTTDAVATGDKIHWICIKNLSETSTDGICVVLDAGTAAWDVGDGIIIGAGEMTVIKAPNTTVADLHGISVTMDGTYGYPTGTNGSVVKAHIAALLDDV
jgi:hypothetical protein